MVRALSVLLSAGMLASLVASAASRPNIIYIMADDLGYGDLGCYGQQVLQTPRIDQLSREGMRFTDHYAGHTVCRPSRLVLLTGRHSGNTAISSNAPYHFPQGARTVTSLLQEAGYHTGGIGKWALGGAETTGAPWKQGFDFWFGYLDQSRAHNFYPEYLWRNDGKFPLRGNVEGPQKNVSTSKESWSHTAMTGQSLEWIRKAKDRQPFLFQAHYTVPHTNNEAGRVEGDGQEVPDYGRWKDEEWPNPEKGFAEMISRLDRDVGRIVDLLKELGIEKNTLVLFTSDNGPHQEGGHEMEFFNSNGPLRGYKRDLYDGGIRVPMIAWWPETIAPDSVTDHPSAFWDFLPTACELAGITPPDDIDGISYLPTLTGRAQKAHEHLYWQSNDQKQAVRKGPWKGVRVKKGGPVELYDLRADIGERNNVADDHPDLAA
jgi:uncharacterized sulfatase